MLDFVPNYWSLLEVPDKIFGSAFVVSHSVYLFLVIKIALHNGFHCCYVSFAPIKTTISICFWSLFGRVTAGLIECKYLVLDRYLVIYFYLIIISILFLLNLDY